MDFLEDEFKEILNIFQVESEEIISRLNNSFLELEKKPNNKDIMNLIFRDAHSLKGAARMIGFNNIQNLSHKIEDILGLAKVNKLSLTPKIADSLYKTVDFISYLIQNSITNGKEIYDEKIPLQIEILENIKNTEKEQPKVEKTSNETTFNTSAFKNYNDNISKNIIEFLFNLMLIEQKTTIEGISNLLNVITALYEDITQIGLYDLKMSIEDIKLKLEFTKNGSQMLTVNEIQELQNLFNTVINDYSSICEVNGINPVDFYSKAFNKIDNVKTDDNEVEKSVSTSESTLILEENKDNVEALDDVLGSAIEIISDEKSAEDISKTVIEQIKTKDDILKTVLPVSNNAFDILTQLKEKLNNIEFSNYNDIKNLFEKFERYYQDANISKIIEGINKILEYSRHNEMQPDNETKMVILQCIDYIEKRISNQSDNKDAELIFQRLVIVQQLMELNTPKNSVSTSNFTKKVNKIFDTGEIKTLRVDSHKLDLLVNQMGELIITKIKTKKHLEKLEKINIELEDWQRTFAKTFEHLKYYDKKYFRENPSSSFFTKQLMNLFSQNSQEIAQTIFDINSLHRIIQDDEMKTGLIIDDMQGMVKNIRVLPLATVFHMFGRMVRDIAKERGKEIDLEIVGSDTNADKKIIEEIKTPLIHIIRNAVDHGIETPEERTKLGKNPVGKIVLSAKHLANKILIEVIDDGSGINIEKIKKKALDNGILTSEELSSMTNEEITNIIFLPGFSTSKEITNISGRGIGLDVVQSKISQLNGRLNVTSEVNKGCHIQIELPVTMATVKVFLVKCASQIFAIPMSSINAVLRKKITEIKTTSLKNSIIFNGKSIPLYDLAKVLHIEREKNSDIKEKETILIVENDNKLIGFVVDKLIGDSEILHKKLCAPIYKLKNISGVTTLASGEICLILNVGDLFKTASNPLSKEIFTKIESLGVKKSKYSYKNILLVDDSITTRTLEKNILTSIGFNVVTTTDPIEAFKILQDKNFDLIISDIEMPSMDGFEFLKRLKSDEQYCDIPVILVSSLNDTNLSIKAKKSGAERLIIKGDFNQKDFLSTIEKIMEKSDG